MALATISATTFDAFLKEAWIDKKYLHKLDAFRTELLGLLPKDTSFEGEGDIQVPVEVAGVVGGSATYARAIANASAGVDKRFTVPIRNRYHVMYLEDKVIKQARSPKGSAAGSVVMRKMASLRNHYAQTLNFQLYRDGGGAVARLQGTGSINFSSTTGSFTDATKSAIQFIRPDMVLKTGPNKDGSSIRTGTKQVSAVKYGENRVVFTEALRATTTALDYDDYVFIDGDQAAAVDGLETYVPLTDAVAATTKHGVDRNIDPRALAGIRIAAQGISVEENLIEAVSQAEQFSEDGIDGIFIHSSQHAKLIKELSGRARWIKTDARSLGGKGKDTRFGYSGLAIDANGKQVPVYAAPACQSQAGWVLNMGSWLLTSMGPQPFVRDEDGLQMLRQTDTSYIFELFGYVNLVCPAPGNNVVLDFSRNS